MAFEIEYGPSLQDDLKGLPAKVRGQIIDRIDEQLKDEPTRQTRNRKPLLGFEPPWDRVGPSWELRIREYRVFYDVIEEEARVVVRAIRKKLPHQTTEESI